MYALHVTLDVLVAGVSMPTCWCRPIGAVLWAFMHVSSYTWNKEVLSMQQHSRAAVLP